MGKKLTYDYVKKYFQDQGCEMLDTEYKNARTHINYKCSCENISRTVFDHFKRGHRCKKCGDKKQAYTYEYVYNYFKDNRCELIEDKYVNAQTKMKYKCSCGEISKIVFSDFRRGHRCKKCAVSKRSHTYEYVKKYFEKNGCVLLEKKYKNDKTPLRYKCSCGNKGKMQFGNFKQGQRCMICGNKNTANKIRLSFEYVKHRFEENNCKLLEEKYISNRVKMRYRCSCGSVCKITFRHCEGIIRCKKCALSDNSGENHYRWIKNREDYKERKGIRARCFAALRIVLKKTGQKKRDKTEKMLGYTVKEFQHHIYNHPNWKNVMGQKWHLDHIFPIKAFLDYGIKDIKLINCLDNLQPLSVFENLSKNDKYNRDKFERWLIEKKAKF